MDDLPPWPIHPPESLEEDTESIDERHERLRSMMRRLGMPVHESPRERRFSDTDKPVPTFGRFQVAPRPGANMDGPSSGWDPILNDRISLDQTESAPPGPTPSLPLEQHICAAAECAIIKVFHTMELLELIFSFLDHKDIHSVRAINQHSRNTVRDSKRLRLRLFVEPQYRRPGAGFELLSLNVPGLDIKAGEEIDRGQWVEVSFTSEGARHVSPYPNPAKRVRSRSIFEGMRGGLGPSAQNDAWPANNTTSAVSDELQYEGLLISQPPIFGMQVFVIKPQTASQTSEQEGDESELPAARAKIASDSGITLGFLAETAQSFLTRKDGPSEPEETKVVFKAIMSFSEPDQTSRKRSGKRTVFYI